MVFEIYTPAYPLGQFISSFIYYQGYNPSHSIDRFLPDGHINVVMSLSDAPQYIYDNETLKEIQACRHVWFSGIRNNYITIPSGKESEMFIINFHRGKAYPFVNMPLHELTDYVVDGDLVLSHEIMELREMIQDAPIIMQKFQRTEKFLLKKFASRLIINPFIDYAVTKITQSPNQLSIEQIANKVGYSQKHLIQLFKEKVGLPPKGFLKIMRFQKVVEDISISKTLDWKDIAFESGYYDQAHFINDFKAFSGFTPNQFLSKNSEHLNYIAVG